MLSNRPITIKVPGKLMIVGEFAVLEPHQKLVVMAVDRFVYATLTPSLSNQLTLENYNLNELSWKYSNGSLVIPSGDRRTRFVQRAMTIALTYLQEKSIFPNPFSLTIKSELNDSSGTKYGLGSSAAVVVSVISVILEKYLPEAPSRNVLFKLAATSHIKTQGNGSGADIAASVYGGLLEYSSIQADWLHTTYKNTSTLVELLDKEWPYFSLQSLQLPKQMHMCVGWTGAPASTKNLVNKILRLKQHKPKDYTAFLEDSKKAVHLFIRGIKESNSDFLFTGIRKNRASLRTLGEQADVEIETPLLSELSDLAESANGAGKLSGAGGGDCGIALVSSTEEKERLALTWDRAGIKPLTIDLSLEGSQVIQ